MPDPAEPKTEQPLVLVIDDDKAFLTEIEGLLATCGYSTAPAHDAYEALALSKQIRPIAVVIDVVLPDIEGPQLCRLLRQTPGYESIPIVFTTGREKTNVLRECLAAGGNDFIRKSHLELELPFRLESHLRLKRENDRLLTRNREQNTLLYFTRLLNRSLSLPSVLQSMVEEMSQIVGADRASVILWNENTGKILATAESGWIDVELDLDKYPEVRQALDTRQTVYIPDVAEDDQLSADHREDLLHRNIQSLLVVPMQTGGNLLGTLFLRTTRPKQIDQGTVAFCQAAAEIACRAILNAHLFEHVRAERDRLLQASQESDGSRLATSSELMDLLRSLHLNLTAEALSTVNLISGYTELLLEPRDVANLDSRQVRGLRMIQNKTRSLERLIRMYQYMPIHRGSKPMPASQLMEQVVQELRPVFRENDMIVRVELNEDWGVPDAERFRTFFMGLLRHYMFELPANSEIRVVIDDHTVAIRFAADGAPRSPSEDDEFPYELWHQIASLHGLDLNHQRDAAGPAQTVLTLVRDRA